MDFIKEDWNSTASAYEVFHQAPGSYSLNIEWPCIRKLLPEIKGKSVLDLGCGTGIFTFLLEQYKPWKLMGLDLSDEMLRIAKQKAKEKNSRALFMAGDAAKAAAYVREPVDFVFSSTTAHYIENLQELFDNVHKCMKAGGTGIFSVIHPVYSAMYPIAHGDSFPSDEEWVVRYLDRSKRAYIQPWIEYNADYENRLSRSFHHTFADYINAILKAGLQIEAMEEPLPPEAWKTAAPGRYQSFIETPTYMIIKFTKKGQKDFNRMEKKTNENYWKDAYKNTWGASSQREKKLMDYLEEQTGMKCKAVGLGAGSSAYISGSAARNGYEKGDADILVEGTNIYIEVTGPLTESVQETKPLWFRPDKLNNAIKNSKHDVFLAHHCMSADLWRVIHIDQEFIRRFRGREFPVVTPFIRGRRERYVEIGTDDKCIHHLNDLVAYLKKKKETQGNG